MVQDKVENMGLTVEVTASRLSFWIWNKLSWSTTGRNTATCAPTGTCCNHMI
jgi:hypothetical protein